MAQRPRLLISAPFGNYLQPHGFVATMGTFTALDRPGRIGQMIKTLRYYPRLRAWVNKIGLRNPGIDWVVGKVRSGKLDVSDKLVSIHGFSADDWWKLLDKTAPLKPLGFELNMSCPNVGEIDWPEDLFERAVATGVPVIVKLPPVQYEDMFQQALAAGVRSFHACNTLPVKAGGLSGQPLKPVALQCIRRLPELTPEDIRDELRIIGGGGVREPEDVDLFAAAGVHAIAVGTKVMNPRYLFGFAGIESIRVAGEKQLAGRPEWI